MTKDSEDIAPSNQALNKAASWLGVSDPQKLLDEDPAASAFQARPEGLGLGAKFLPHHKAVHLTAPLEKRFQKRLARESAGAEQDAGSPVLAKKARAQQQKGKSMHHEDGDSSDDDDKGRAKAFGPARSTNDSQTSLKQQLLVPGKRKKQQHKQQPVTQQQHKQQPANQQQHKQQPANQQQHEQQPANHQQQSKQQ